MDSTSRGMGREKAGYLEGWVSVAVNLILFTVKMYAGLVSSSIAVVADAFHTLSDCITSLALILGYKIAFKPPDEEHPFGHQRFEAATSIVIGTLLGVVGFEFINRSVDKLLAREALVFSWIAVVVLTVSAVVKEALARWALRLAESVGGAESIRADAWHHRSDAVATLLVVIGLMIGESVWWVDGLLGLLVSGLIIYVAYDIIKRASQDILGRAPSSTEVSVLREIASGVSGDIRDLHHVHIHEYGDHIEVTLHIRLPPGMKLSDAHEVASRLEDAIRRTLGWEATIHVEPYRDQVH
ncbi:cation diffusion facilitator family transporter [Desulfurococcus mucosus]|uniref:Cation diffusion facilitator family transporter n=1 Tax=Desulfurococcus mucosus (strain ATCC 35584 / DSM 2162 / JCM 9187 / O7/1) TaxID=765177 RepID=E8R8Y6_DESM0|nr:cation diffusion facilitator family transporter [Desulfurococcus mucosus]ADV64962.1 cation diffusion facilitator family transporter [Desulfurococcus mucosus DSM 2162]